MNDATKKPLTAIQIRTIMDKERGSWRAKSTIDLGIKIKHGNLHEEALPAVLTVSTYKTDRGMGTFASVHAARPDGTMTHVFGLGAKGIGDFSETVKRHDGARCTEKAVTTLHAECMGGIAEIVTRAKAFYAAQAQAADTNTRRARELAEADAAAEPKGRLYLEKETGATVFDPRGEDIALGHVKS